MWGRGADVGQWGGWGRCGAGGDVGVVGVNGAHRDEWGSLMGVGFIDKNGVH